MDPSPYRYTQTFSKNSEHNNAGTDRKFAIPEPYSNRKKIKIYIHTVTKPEKNLKMKSNRYAKFSKTKDQKWNFFFFGNVDKKCLRNKSEKYVFYKMFSNFCLRKKFRNSVTETFPKFCFRNIV